MHAPQSPVFLVGAERSGTTLLRLMLDHHPALSFQPEFEFVVDRMPPGGTPDPAAYLEAIASDRSFLDLGLSPNAALSYPALVRDLLEQCRVRSGKPRVGATVHYHFDRLLELWPDARFVHLVRDPRDVAQSTVKMGWAGNGFVGVERWLEAEALWLELEPRLPPGRAVSLRYEELVRDPRGTLTALCRFIGLEFDEAMLRYPEDSSYAPVDPSLAEQWRRSEPSHVQQVEARVGPLLEPRGYQPSGLPAIEPTWWRRLGWRLDSRAKRTRFRIRRYSWGVFLQDVLSRRLHLGGWQRRVRARVAAIDARYIK